MSYAIVDILLVSPVLYVHHDGRQDIRQTSFHRGHDESDAAARHHLHHPHHAPRLYETLAKTTAAYGDQVARVHGQRVILRVIQIDLLLPLLTHRLSLQ